MARELTQREMASMGGKALAKKYRKRQRQAWGRRGGRPAKLTPKKLARVKRDLAGGQPHAEIALRFGVSLRTVGRIAAGMRTKTGWVIRMPLHEGSLPPGGFSLSRQGNSPQQSHRGANLRSKICNHHL